ncbi:hypothetical protein F441_15840 [Phytophthora nicotianae CJ01A1]|uniref:BED-type domain-containing protein n=5 Tax=Phytophthora nicotianae TaxID=4792 RepID=V9EG91_PHYNI|nr:hypothetical protein F443_16005 [Phytophthora nicotianae P1569]ETK78406.1 hypothetical protein L915_15552 [Phytophthora nicotianae]ETL31828.1 hypothetical protein L916_15455 [Phytophthora nicotianae]ETO66970.1 hypothetical protein F444_15986 [Phytophthora nicotianae P1976]ETP08068.1 hypothetical protein F441_15840 [Phytophthora nicotianae CJ01A1]
MAHAHFQTSRVLLKPPPLTDMGKHEIWKHFTKVVPAQKGVKQHPDVQCNYCNKMIYNAQRKKNLAPHFAGTKRNVNAKKSRLMLLGDADT